MSVMSINHNFLVEGTLLNSNGTSKDISKNIINIMVRKRFLEESFPLFVIDLKLTEKLRDEIRDSDCQIYLKVSYFNINSETGESVDSMEHSAEGVIFDDVIRIYEKPFDTTVSKKDYEGDTDGNSQTESAPFVYYRVSGIPEKLISKNEGNLNFIFKNTELSDVMIFLLSRSGCDNVVIQETENKETFDNVIIPPLSLIPAVNLLQKYYKIYKYGLTLFFDSNSTYCFSTISPDRPITNSLNINVLDNDVTEGLNERERVMLDSETSNIKINSMSLPSISKNTKIVKHIAGSETVFYSYDDRFNLSTRNAIDNESYNKVRYIWNDNLLKEFEDDYSLISNSDTTVSLKLSNINPNLINPLTRLNINSTEYPDVSGEYIISNLAFNITTDDLEVYKGGLIITGIKNEV